MSKEHPLNGDDTSTGDNRPESTKPISTCLHPAHVTIGPYKILETLGEGGMGVVYLAEQTVPIHRKVALKLIKLGMDTRQVIARFDSERQALAMMDHPHVAKVFDAGTTEQGRPYFVMEYVRGIPITDYCDKLRLTTKERLTLFMQVCHAIQHAHQKGIIHRDIKPSNVLVTVEDDQPKPKVIDFGVAKATQQKLTEQTLFTEQGQLVGTPEYMSPEQAEMTALDIDTRTDIYSLGVLLYQLLAGALPFEPSSLRKAAFGEIQRIICEQEPPKPSTRLSGLGDESGTVAKRRRTTRAALEKQLHGDLDWITMKALEKDRTRRYPTATEFAADIQRHLGNEPVLANPPGAAYRAKKFIRRNKGGVIAVTAIFVALLLGLIGTSWGFSQAFRNSAEAIRQRDEALLAKRAETAALTDAEQQRNVAEVERGRALKAERDARSQTYFANIAAAQAALANNEIATVHRLLDTAPEEFSDWEWAYLFSEADRSLATLEAHGDVMSVAFSRDGARLVSVTLGENVQIWEASTGEELSSLQLADCGVWCVAYTPDFKRAASACERGSVRVWEVATGNELINLQGHTRSVRSVSFSPDGSRLVSGSLDGTVRLWNVDTWETLATLHGEAGGARNCVVFSPDGTHVAWASDRNTVGIWDSSTGEQLPFMFTHRRNVSCVAYAPDGTRIATGSDDNTVRVWDTSTGNQLAEMRGHRGRLERLNFIAFTPDGTRMASASDDRTVRLWDASTGDQLV